MIPDAHHHLALRHRLDTLLAPSTDGQLAAIARQSQELTRAFFGRTIRLFAPLYLSNECINSCAYCGFSRENAILRVTLDLDAVRAEGLHLAAQ
jgi:2-iminoacetate synthase